VLPELSNQVVVVFLRADPKPDDQIAMLLGKSAIVITDSHGPDVSDKRLERHWRVERVAQPEWKLFSRQTLDMSR
jgi:hypothetical protein